MNKALNYNGEHICKQPPKEVTSFSMESYSSYEFRGLMEVVVDIMKSERSDNMGKKKNEAAERDPPCIIVVDLVAEVNDRRVSVVNNSNVSGMAGIFKNTENERNYSTYKVSGMTRPHLLSLLTNLHSFVIHKCNDLNTARTCSVLHRLVQRYRSHLSDD